MFPPTDPDEVEEFEKFLQQGGQAWLDEESAKADAEWKRRIREGEVSREALEKRIRESYSRLGTFIQIGITIFIRKEAELLLKHLEDLELWDEENLEESEE